MRERLVKDFVVARKRQPMSTRSVCVSLAMLGGGVFLLLADARATHAQPDSQLPPLATGAMSQLAPLPAIPATTEEAAKPVAAPSPLPSPPLPSPAVPQYNAASERAHAPALIVDLAQNTASSPGLPDTVRTLSDGSPGAIQSPGAFPSAVSSVQPGKALSDAEQFSKRVGKEEVDRVEATQLADLGSLVAQGTIIGAVMETALNSDLPGFARASILRDVLSFDGSAVLIPAGSRVIGQYKSGVAKGASRIFIVWTRILRPDGVSIALGSPAIDDQGRGGVAGKVNSHFLKRFGGSILLTVLTGGIQAGTAALSRGSTVVVSSANEATQLAQQAASDLDIPATITTKAGAAVRIFVARDLDFSSVGSVR